MKTICSACRSEVNEKEAPRGWLWVCPACGAKAAELPEASEDAAIAAMSGAAGSDLQGEGEGEGEDDVDVDVDLEGEGEDEGEDEREGEREDEGEDEGEREDEGEGEREREGEREDEDEGEGEREGDAGAGVGADVHSMSQVPRLSHAPISLAPISLDDAEVLSVPPPAIPPLPPTPRPVPAARISGPASARRMARANPTQSAPGDEPAARPQSFAQRLASKAFSQDPEVSPSARAAAVRAAADAKTAREEERLPDSGLFDIRSMIAKPQGNARQERRVNEDILNLSGGLFSSATSTPLVPLIAPDLSALNAPRPSQTEVVAPATAPHEPRDLAARDLAARELAARPPILNDDDDDTTGIAAPRGRAKMWALAVLAIGLMGGAFIFARGDATGSGEKTNATVEAQAAVVERPSSPVPPPAGADPSPRPPSKPIEEPSIDDGDSKAKPKGTEKQPPAGDGKPAAPVRTTTTANVGTRTPTAPKTAEPPVVTAPPAAEGQKFNVGAASAALGSAAGQAAGCKAPGDPSGSARISVTFAASGRATSANVNGPPFAGTPTGSCIASIFRRTTVPPFSGSSVTVNKSVAIR